MPFSLFRLPEKAINEVLRTMKILEKIGFSMISKKAHMLAACNSPVINPYKCSIDLINSTDICISRYWHHVTCCMLENGTFRVHDLPLNRDMTTHLWKIQRNFETRELIDHLMVLFNVSTVAEVDVNCSNSRSLFSQTNLDGLKVEKVLIREFTGNSNLAKYLPYVEKISIVGGKSESKNDWTTFHNVFNLAIFFSVTLNDLLLMNNPIISLQDTRLSNLDLKLLIKHWVNGWNPDLELFIFYIYKDYPHSCPELLVPSIAEESDVHGMRAYRIKNIHGTVRIALFGGPDFFVPSFFLITTTSIYDDDELLSNTVRRL